MMTYAKKRSGRNEVSALNSLLFLKLAGPDDALLDSIGAAKAWVAAGHMRVDYERGRKSQQSKDAQPPTQYVTEAVDATAGDEIELDTDIHESLDEFDQLGLEPDMVAQEPLFFLDVVEETVYTADLDLASDAVASNTEREAEPQVPFHVLPPRKFPLEIKPGRG